MEYTQDTADRYVHLAADAGVTYVVSAFCAGRITGVLIHPTIA